MPSAYGWYSRWHFSGGFLDGDRSDMASREHKRVPTSKSADLCQTPGYALDPLLAYLDKNCIIWESAAGQGNLTLAFQEHGFKVVSSDILTGQNFFKWQPLKWDVTISNPPFSHKVDWLARCYELGKPFALLLPVEILGVGAAQKMFARFGVEIILLNRRVDFQTVNTSFAKSSSWFPTAWFCSGLNIGREITYGTIIKRPDAQLSLLREAG